MTGPVFELALFPLNTVLFPGQKLPLPNRQDVLARFADSRDSCPRGIKYVNDPWQDRVIDAFRQTKGNGLMTINQQQLLIAGAWTPASNVTPSGSRSAE